jgi:hypothetical protein
MLAKNIGPAGYGMYQRNSAVFDQPLTVAEIQRIRAFRGAGTAHPYFTHVLCRWAWRRLQPDGLFTGSNAVYSFALVDEALALCAEAGLYLRIQIQHVNNTVKGEAGREINSPVPLALFNGGFNEDFSKAKPPYGGGCYYTEQGAKRKIWPNIWNIPTHREYGHLVANLLLHIKASPHAQWFGGIQIPETSLQNSGLLPANPHPEIAYSAEGTVVGWKHILTRIAETWPELMHGVYANWYGRELIKDQWMQILDHAASLGIGYGCPDTYSMHSNGKPIRADQTKVGEWAFGRYRDKIPIIMGSQNSAMSFGDLGAKGTEGAAQMIAVAQSLGATLLCAAQAGGDNWSFDDFLVASRKASLPGVVVPAVDVPAVGEPIKPEPVPDEPPTQTLSDKLAAARRLIREVELAMESGNGA